MNRRELLQQVALLMGGAISAPAILGVLSGCSAKKTERWQPQFLAAAQAALVGEIAEIILPRTDTPGARDVGVLEFIDRMLNDVYPQDDRTRYLHGLKAFEAAAQLTYGKPFVQLEAAQRLSQVQKFHDAATRAERAMESAEAKLRRSFILMTKELTLLGFFTSQPGATQVLQHVAIPGEYRACVPLAQAGKGKAWAE